MDDFRDYRCPGCKKVLTIPTRYGGRLMPCPFCGRLQRTPLPCVLSPMPPARVPSSARRSLSGQPSNKRRALMLFCLLTVLLLIASSVLRQALDGPGPAPAAVSGSRAAAGRRQAELDIGDWERKLDAWRTKQRVTRTVLDRLGADETQMLDRLADLGVKSAADVHGNRKALVYAEELQEIVRQKAAAQQTCDEWDEAIARLESVIRRTKRALDLAQTGITDREKADLLRTVLELDNRVETMAAGGTTVPERDLDALLNEKLGPGREGR
jgi:hypothetical protein